MSRMTCLPAERQPTDTTTQRKTIGPTYNSWTDYDTDGHTTKVNRKLYTHRKYFFFPFDDETEKKSSSGSRNFVGVGAI
jgi:hypothetical protein